MFYIPDRRCGTNSSWVTVCIHVRVKFYNITNHWSATVNSESVKGQIIWGSDTKAYSLKLYMWQPHTCKIDSYHECAFFSWNHDNRIFFCHDLFCACYSRWHKISLLKEHLTLRRVVLYPPDMYNAHWKLLMYKPSPLNTSVIHQYFNILNYGLFARVQWVNGSEAECKTALMSFQIIT